MDLQELLEEFRNQVADTVQPYLWSDNEVLRYAIDAQDMFVRRTGGISDMTTAAICDLSVVADTPFTAHSPYILRIMSGRLETSLRDIEFIHENQLDSLREADYGYDWVNAYTLDDTDTGEVRYGVLGLQEKQIRWVRVPDTSETCRIRVFRLPYPRLPTAWADIGADDVLEIDEIHHYHLLKWMKHLAYSKQDVEARDDKKAEFYRLDFLRYTEEARGELDRRRYKPRIVKYGGI